MKHEDFNNYDPVTFLELEDSGLKVGKYYLYFTDLILGANVFVMRHLIVKSILALAMLFGMVTTSLAVAYNISEPRKEVYQWDKTFKIDTLLARVINQKYYWKRHKSTKR